MKEFISFIYLIVSLVCLISSPKQNETDGPLNGEFKWDAEEQGLILSAYFYGNLVTQLIGGTMAEKYGGKWVFASAGLLGAIGSLLSPVAARAGMGWFIASRALFGAGQVKN